MNEQDKKTKGFVSNAYLRTESKLLEQSNYRITDWFIFADKIRICAKQTYPSISGKVIYKGRENNYVKR